MARGRRAEHLVRGGDLLVRRAPISATVTLAACSGVFVALATPGDLGGYRTGLVIGLGIALALMLLATVASAVDRDAHRPSVPTACGRRAR